MTEQTKKQTLSTEDRTVKALEDMQRDIRSIYLMVSTWFALFVLGLLIVTIVALNS